MKDYSLNQTKVGERFLKLSQEYSISLVATNDIHYIERSDWRAHEILLNVQSGEPAEIWERDSRGNAKAKVLNPKRDTMTKSDKRISHLHTQERRLSDGGASGYAPP